MVQVYKIITGAILCTLLMTISILTVESKYAENIPQYDQNLEANIPIKYIAKRRFLPTRRDLLEWPISYENNNLVHLDKYQFMKLKRDYLTNRRNEEKQIIKGLV
ncbi:unnamed protein product [Didymodactylos carnosus]|uniref:Uncharacterized protein n=1 Tax=Didymodactylos carnosus TaxID=1234261 RepID=A0A815NGT5_9BILA|nr:unnamed protein product [Didymodactylos carnosus]CAF1431755.1 unnamed protein product [Didymodactylos carnosus]CAF4074364.1 unnamed protein product [Didymodactylos carnosus]CAF4310277.1 unnamed protein product [Didymodactylos carnosus]